MRNLALNLILKLMIILILPLSGAAKTFDWNTLPTVVTDPRVDAAYGTFGSNLSLEARPLQTELDTIESKIHGIPALLAQKSNIEAAEILYRVEVDLLDRLQELNFSEDKITNFDRAALQKQLTRLYRYVRVFSEKYYQDMIRYIDIRLPGPNGLQLPSKVSISNPSHQVQYSPNYRRDSVLSEDEKDKEYRAKVQEFEKKGGNLNEIFVLNEKTMESLGKFTRVEYILTPNYQIRASSGNAGHILLAEGKKVLSAGQILIMKDRFNKIAFVVITNASGSYKPDFSSAQNFAEKFSRRFDVPMSDILLTMGEPLSTQIFKIYQKADGVDSEISKKQSKELEKIAKVLYDPIKVGNKCPVVYTGAVAH